MNTITITSTDGKFLGKLFRWLAEQESEPNSTTITLGDYSNEPKDDSEEIIEVNLEHVSEHDRKVRILWQALYNIYSENGGDLTNLDNLLIDLQNCDDVINDFYRSASIRYFCFNKGDFTTSWSNFSSGKLAQLISSWDFVYQIDSIRENMIITRVTNG